LVPLDKLIPSLHLESNKIKRENKLREKNQIEKISIKILIECYKKIEVVHSLLTPRDSSSLMDTSSFARHAVVASRRCGCVRCRGSVRRRRGSDTVTSVKSLINSLLLWLIIGFWFLIIISFYFWLFFCS
jgi:hypothetical protein